MRKLIFLFIVFGVTKLYAGISDTVIAGIPVVFNYAVSIFPESWQTTPTNATGAQIDDSEIDRSQRIIDAAFAKYPDNFLSAELSSVYFLKSMSFYDVGFGGTNSNDAVYLTNSGIADGYTDKYIESTFHHEFSSILIRNHSGLISRENWEKISAAGNTDPEAGVGAIRNNAASTEIDTNFCRIGFLTQYSLSDFENDVNLIAQNLFSPDPEFWNVFDSYPLVRQKAEMLIAFYHSLNPIFTEVYFREFSN